MDILLSLLLPWRVLPSLDQMTRQGVSDSVWDQYSASKVKKDKAFRDAERAEMELSRCEESWSRFIPGNMQAKKLSVERSKAVFLAARKHSLEKKKKMTYLDMREMTESKETMETGLRVLESASKSLSSALEHVTRPDALRKQKKKKMDEWQSCSLEMMNGFFFLCKAKERNPSMKVSRAMGLTSDALKIVQKIVAEMEPCRADRDRDDLPEFLMVRTSLESAIYAVNFAIDWQHAWLARYREM